MQKTLFSLFIFVLSASFSFGAEEWTMSNGIIWSRDSNAATLTQDGNKVNIVHTGKQDWALSEGNRIVVVPGDMFELKAQMSFDGENHVAVSVVTRNADGETAEWTYAVKGLTSKTPLTELTTQFMIPPGIATIEPRITGFAPAKVTVNNFTLKYIGKVPIAPPDAKPHILENAFLKVNVMPAGTFSVTDKRTKRIWKTADDIKNFVTIETRLQKDVVLVLVNTENLSRFNVVLSLATDAPELSVQLKGVGPMQGNIAYPPAFVSEPKDRLIVPVNEGMGYPVEEKNIGIGRLIAYGGHGICMPFWGQVSDADGSGMMGILETPDDVSIDVHHGKSGLLQTRTLWEPSFKEFRYDRVLRFVFFDKGGHVAVCKRYRQHAKETQLFEPFTEKVKYNPNIDKLLGAANIWTWDYNQKNAKAELVKEMQRLGMDRILWSGGGSAEDIVALNALENVLTSRYDIYQDVMNPEHFDKVWVHGDWTTEAWDKDLNWISADGNWRKGWNVDQKDKTQPRIPCGVICDAKAVPYAQKRISKELETKPFQARFLDTTVASPWFECYHPDHPMTRSDSKIHKMDLLKLIGDFGMVCGSETGHDASVPFCDYYEGMLSLGPYRVNESGRNMQQIVEEVPPQIERFQVNPALRLPLWELVYHDCVVAQWYWGDYNNKLPKVWRKRDLFNALYGTPPMYMFTKKNWDENKQKFAESYKTAATAARKTAYAEMTDHRVLSADRMVQQTHFSNGTIVTVNFGEKPFTLPDGSVLNGLDWKVR